MSHLRQNGFIYALLAVLGLAILMPGPGLPGGPLAPELTTRIAVFLIFLMQGLGLASDQLTRGFLQWRLHVFVQGWNFLGAVAVIGGLAWLFSGLLPRDLFAGLLYLAVLPTTVSSAVAFTTIARGEVSGAIFNGALSQFIGVIVTPLWTVFLLAGGGEGAGGDLAATFQKLFVLIILPLLLGQAIRPFAAAGIKRIKPVFKPATSGMILFIVYCAFAQSVERGIWQSTGLGTVALTLGVVLLAVVAMHGTVWVTAGWARFDRPTRIAALMTGSQKTLAAGVPMATAVFASATIAAQGYDLGLALLPLLAYHPMQLVFGAWLAPRLAKGVEDGEA